MDGGTGVLLFFGQKKNRLWRKAAASHQFSNDAGMALRMTGCFSELALKAGKWLSEDVPWLCRVGGFFPVPRREGAWHQDGAMTGLSASFSDVRSMGYTPVTP